MNAVAQFQPARLPWAPAIEERFGALGVTKTSWKALIDAVWPTAKTVDGVVLALSYCQARNLDPFKKPVHIVPVWSSALGRQVEGVWPGISELRTTAMRTSNYAGCDETAFGPDITRDFNWSDNKGQHTCTVTFPEWGQTTLYRLLGGQRVGFAGPKVYWLETYATVSRSSDAPNEMWRKRPRGQLDKCAEAAALRKAFPEEIGNEYAAEEMAGRAVGVDGAPVGLALTGPVVPVAAVSLHADFEDAPPEHDATFTETPSEAPQTDGGEQPDPEVTGQSAAPQAIDEAAGQTADLTLAQKADALVERINAATGTVKMQSIWAANAKLRDAIDKADPGRLVEIEKLFNEKHAQLEDVGL